MSVRKLNSTLRRAQARTDELEEKLVDVVTPILHDAGEVAASNFERYATEHVQASAERRRADLDILNMLGAQQVRGMLRSLALTAAVDVQSNSTMICVRPRPEEAARIADADGYKPERLHCTLVFLGEIDGPLAPIADALRVVAGNHAALSGAVGGYGQFGTPGGPVGILLPDVPGLVEVRVAVTEALVEAGIEYARDHGFEAHLTVDDEPEPGELEMMLPLTGAPLHFDNLCVVRGDTEEIVVPFVGVKARTAAAGRKFCLPDKLRSRTAPVKGAAMETVMRESVEGVGVRFDVTNPFARHALEKGSGQITEISRTTQRDVMRVIHAEYVKGSSIKTTADAIRDAMRDTAPARATLIARTELAGATNGGSLAAVQMVADATGDTYHKTWLVAPGAHFPRHEDYEGLDGQTVPLDGTFQVGNDALEHPGDPNGSPEEICNCRCTMIYGGEQTDESAANAMRIAMTYRPRPFIELGGENPAAVRAEIAFIEEQLATFSGGPDWSAPAASEVLNIDCETARTVSVSEARVSQIAKRVEAIRAKAAAKNVEGATPSEALDQLLDSGKITEAEHDAVTDWYDEH